MLLNLLKATSNPKAPPTQTHGQPHAEELRTDELQDPSLLHRAKLGPRGKLCPIAGAELADMHGACRAHGCAERACD